VVFERQNSLFNTERFIAAVMMPLTEEEQNIQKEKYA